MQLKKKKSEFFYYVSDNDSSNFFLNTFPLGRTCQKFKPNPNEIFLRSKNILAWVRFEFLGNQAFIRGCGGEAPARVSEQNLVRLGQVVRSI